MESTSKSKGKDKNGKVYLVGAGPGDLGLVTLRAKECIESADVIVYDHLANPEILGWARDDAEIIYAGKAHPNDGGGKDIIRHIFQAKKALRKAVPIVFLDDYNLDLGGKITSGVDLWLNTPQFPLEASGTSGMKAALNGVPSLSILDGWWVEGHIEGVTGWSIGEPRRVAAAGVATDNAAEAESLYSKLEGVILPLYYAERSRFLGIMQHAIAINGSFFNTQRMVQQYITDAYLH